MVSRTIVYDRSQKGEAAAVLNDGVLDDFLFSLEDGDPDPGTVFHSIADRQLKGQGAWTVRLPGGRRGYLRTGRDYEQGARILTQVSGIAEPGKLAPVSDRAELSGRFAVVTGSRQGVSVSRKIRDASENQRVRQAAQAALEPFHGLGVIVRSSAANAGDDLISEEIRRLAREFNDLADMRESGLPKLVRAAPSVLDRAVADWGEAAHIIDRQEGSWERHGIADLLDPFAVPETALANGGSLVIEPTRALTAIDINSGADTTRKSSLRTNLAAAKELPRQLRIRGLGGQIVIDFAPTAKKDRASIREILEKAFRSSRVATTLVGWTGLGHFEMHRSRERLPLSRWLTK